MSDSHDKDDWSNDSASLFREARRAHDPTPAESAQLNAVLARIQAATPQATTEAPFAESRSADIAARGATSEMLRLVAYVSLGVVCIAAAYFAFMRGDRNVSGPARSATHAPPAVASAPAPIEVQPAPVPSDELSASAPASAAHAEAPSRAPSQRRRSRADAARPRTSRIEMASAPEASSSASDDSATPDERLEPASSVKPVAVSQETAPRPTPVESAPEEAVTAAARKADPTLPEDARTELATMKRIQAALRDADFSTVLALCADHARRWPHGVFELEREGVRAIASCGENSDDATLRAKHFLTAHPHAPVAMRVRTACTAQLMKRP